MGVGIRIPPSTSSLAEINGSSLQLRNRGVGVGDEKHASQRE
jgi:hypothetical protein